MNFSFSEDQVLLRNSVRAALDEQCAPAHVRAMADDTRGYSEALWSEMAKLGWLGLPFAEEQGGAGLGLVELALVLEEMGRAAYPGPYFASVVLGGLGIQLGGSAAQQERWLPAIASGQARASAALLEDALDWDPASTTATATDIEMRMKQGFSVFVMNWGDAGFKTIDMGRKLSGRTDTSK